jgi:hypothetical protein
MFRSRWISTKHGSVLSYSSNPSGAQTGRNFRPEHLLPVGGMEDWK